MGKKQLEKADREHRVAVLPGWLTEGRKIWYWRETLCTEDLCPDMVSGACPLNRGVAWNDQAAVACAIRHPVVERMTVWSVACYFTPRGIEWSINELPAVADRDLRRVFFPTREAAEARRPEVITIA